MVRRLPLLCFAFLAGCGGDRLTHVDGTLEVSAERLEFPDTFVGSPTATWVQLWNTGRVRRTVTGTVGAPFSGAAEVVVEGGSIVTFEVTFAPEQAGEVLGTLHFESEGTGRDVELHGLAQLPLDCGAAAPCHATAFDPATGVCVDSVLPDDTACAPQSACVSDARCHAGVCLGAERSCDDADRCTTDACDAASGCLHLPVVCPSPTDPCKVAACDRANGCGVADAPDGTACGPADCVTAQVCLAGACQTVQVPEGFTCAPASPCQGKGTCHAQVCEQPSPTVMNPAWQYPVPADHRLHFDGLADDAGNLYWVECAYAACELVSATHDGFIRFRTLLTTGAQADQDGTGKLALVGGEVISTFGFWSVEARSTTDGALLWSTGLRYALSPLVGQQVFAVHAWDLVDLGQGDLSLIASPDLAGCAGVSCHHMFAVALSAATGTVRWVQPAGGDLSRLVGDEQGNLFAAGALRPSDGGFEPMLFSWSSAGVGRWRMPTPTWLSALSTASGRLVLSEGVPALRQTATGGDIAAADAGFENVIWAVEPVLDAVSGFQFFKPPYACCPMCSCPAILPQLRLRSFAAQDATVRWDLPVDPAALPNSYLPVTSEVVLTATGDGLYARSPNDIYLNATGLERLDSMRSSGALRFSCELPGPGSYDGILYAGAAALLKDRWVVAAQPQCFGCVKEPSPVITAFDVPGSALASHGWVSQRGSNARAGRPR